MGRRPCCSKDGMNKGAWTPIEDKLLVDYVSARGQGKWRNIPLEAGLKRCGKSCRLRWLNYLRPGIKRGNISEDEEDLIIRLHKLLGNRWSLIAGRLPGRTDNEIKNYWNTILSKKSQHSNPKKPSKTRKQKSKPEEEEEEDCAGPDPKSVMSNTLKRKKKDELDSCNGSLSSSSILDFDMADMNMLEILNTELNENNEMINNWTNGHDEFGSLASFFELAGEWIV